MISSTCRVMIDAEAVTASCGQTVDAVAAKVSPHREVAAELGPGALAAIVAAT